MPRAIKYGSRGVTYGSRMLLNSGFSSSPPTPSGSLWETEASDANLVLDIYPQLWGTGAISQNDFQSQTPFNSGHWKITNQRFWRETVNSVFPAGPAKDMIRFRDPKLDEGDNTNPWFRRIGPEIDWGAKQLVPTVLGSTPSPGIWAFTSIGLYFPVHAYTSSGVQGWNPGFTIKHLDGWDLGGVGSTGNNPQTSPDVCEIVGTTYGLKTLQNNSYTLTTKGDFGSWETGQTTIDASGTYNPVIDINNFDHYSNYFFLGWGLYAHDTRQTYNYQNMLYQTWPGTNKRILMRTGVEYEMRWMARLETQSSPYNGEFYSEMRIRHIDANVSLSGTGLGAASLPPGIVMDEWFETKRLTDVDFRGNGNSVWLDNGFGFFAGGGNGDSFGSNQYHPSPKPPYYDRNYYIAYKRNWVK